MRCDVEHDINEFCIPSIAQGDGHFIGLIAIE